MINPAFAKIFYVLLFFSKPKKQPFYMKNSEFDYQPEKDDLPGRVMVVIYIIAFIGAVYLSQILI